MNQDEIKSIKEQFQVNDLGLFNSVEYQFDSNGYVDWKKLIPRDCIVLNKQKLDELAKNLNISANELDSKWKAKEIKDEDVDDKYKLVLLLGYKTLASLRGFKSVRYPQVISNDHGVFASCAIIFRGNFETNFEDIEFTALGDATPHNTFSFAKNYLSSIAENRAFARCVRNALRINILAYDELGDKNGMTEESSVDQNPISPHNILLDKLKQKNITFGKLVNQIQAKIVKGDLKKEEFEGIEGWTEASQVPKGTILRMIDMIKKVEEKQKKPEKAENPPKAST